MGDGGGELDARRRRILELRVQPPQSGPTHPVSGILFAEAFVDRERLLELARGLQCCCLAASGGAGGLAGPVGGLAFVGAIDHPRPGGSASLAGGAYAPQLSSSLEV